MNGVAAPSGPFVYRTGVTDLALSLDEAPQVFGLGAAIHEPQDLVLDEHDDFDAGPLDQLTRRDLAPSVPWRVTAIP